MTTGRRHERFEGIELLRFVLALGVMIFHYYFWAPHKALIHYSSWPRGDALVYLMFGVEAFFAVSGFVIVLSTANRRPSEFLIARMARLGPTLLLASSVTLSLYFLLGAQPRVSGAGIEYVRSILFFPLARLGTGLDPSLWSLSFEIRFYLLIFLCMFLFDVRHQALKVGIVMLTYDLVRTAAIAIGHPLPTHFDYFKDYASFFVVGMLLYYRHATGRTGLLWMVSLTAAVALSAFHVTTILTNMYDVSLHLGAVHFWQGTLVAVVILLLMWISMVNVRQPALATAFRATGRASYPLYVVHQLCGYWILNFFTERLRVSVDLRPFVVLLMVFLSLAYGNWLEPALIRLYKRVLTDATGAVASLWSSKALVRRAERHEIAN